VTATVTPITQSIGDRQPWRDQAACLGLSPVPFYPNEDEPNDSKKAKAICATCRVREDCLEFAIANREKYGIWGGMTTEERRLFRRRRTALRRRARGSR
jgi:WhiB family transcriptional regulator, redox-sensing transcriptional regulator